MTAELLTQSIQFIKSQTGSFVPNFGFILGTGLGDLAKEIECHCEIPYQQIPGFPVSTVASHAGKLIFGTLYGKHVVAMSGRFHYYEGYSAQQLTFPVRVLKGLGIQQLFISSAVGSVNEQMNAGDIVIIKDHINLIPDNPLRGPNREEWGPRFPDMKDAYDKKMNARLFQIGKELQFPVHQGVYLALQGPNLETAAEYLFAHRMGADVIGMSTVPEVIVAKHIQLPVLVTCIVSNKCFPIDEIEETTLENVIETVKKAEPKLALLIQNLLRELEIL